MCGTKFYAVAIVIDSMSTLRFLVCSRVAAAPTVNLRPLLSPDSSPTAASTLLRRSCTTHRSPLRLLYRPSATCAADYARAFKLSSANHQQALV